MNNTPRSLAAIALVLAGGFASDRRRQRRRWRPSRTADHGVGDHRAGDHGRRPTTRRPRAADDHDGADHHGRHRRRPPRSVRHPLTGCAARRSGDLHAAAGAGRQDRQRRRRSPQTGLNQADIVFEEIVEGGHPLRRRVQLDGLRPGRPDPLRPDPGRRPVRQPQRPVFAWSGGNASGQRGARRHRLDTARPRATACSGSTARRGARTTCTATRPSCSPRPATPARPCRSLRVRHARPVHAGRRRSTLSVGGVQRAAGTWDAARGLFLRSQNGDAARGSPTARSSTEQRRRAGRRRTDRAPPTRGPRRRPSGTARPSCYSNGAARSRARGRAPTPSDPFTLGGRRAADPARSRAHVGRAGRRRRHDAHRRLTDAVTTTGAIRAGLGRDRDHQHRRRRWLQPPSGR